VDDTERFRLLGTYRTPRCRIGQWVRCAVRGEVQIKAISDGPIPWPMCQTGTRLGLVVYRGLEKAIRTESVQAIAHWWGVGRCSVWLWKKALGVPASTPGTKRLRVEHNKEPWAIEARAKAHAQSRDPIQDQERRQKISEAKRGKPRPPHVIAAIIKAHKGTKASEETRQRMKEAHILRGTLVPGTRVWTPEEDEILRTHRTKEVARLTGRSLAGVIARRQQLGLPDARRRENRLP
jgi:hypothetical protein